MKKTIYYWTPAISRVGTIKTTINSAVSFAKFSKKYDVKIINVFGEWSRYKNYLKDHNVIVENLTFDYYKYLPKYGFLSSRISYIIIILLSVFPLIFLLKKKKPDFLIIHLLTSLPLILWNIFNFKTKLIFRISGFVRLHYIRKKLWNRSQKKIYKILCQTEEQKNLFSSKNVFKINKPIIIPDCIINLNEIKKNKKTNFKTFNNEYENFFIAVGRFSKQKNFIYLIKEFKTFSNKHPNEKLFIFGEGELKREMEKEIYNNNLSQKVKIFNFTEEIYYFMKKSKALIMPSIWEELCLVMVEAAMCNTLVISSNCKSGPEEFLLNGNAGLLFKNNEKNDLANKLSEFLKMNKDQILKKKILAKKNCKKFALLSHFLKLEKIIAGD